MKKITIIQSFLLSAAIVGLNATIPGFDHLAFAAEEQQFKTINVSGEGEISVTPDVAYIQLGVQTQETSVEQAQAENAEAMQKVYGALDKEHVKKEDIQTVSFNVNPIYSWDQNKQVFQGYQVVHILRVTDRDLDHMGQLVDRVTQSGANRIENIQYDTEKREQYQLRALDLAMDNAQQKANHLVEKIGQSNLTIINIHENSGSSGPVYSTYQKSSADNSSTQISTGKISISASVNVSYGF